MHHVEIDGVSYHCNFKWKEEWDDYDETEYELILDERGNPIPSDECICAAWYPSECCCGALDDYNPEWDDLVDWDDVDSVIEENEESDE